VGGAGYHSGESYVYGTGGNGASGRASTTLKLAEGTGGYGGMGYGTGRLGMVGSSGVISVWEFVR
jgi:hypothetical protein